MKFTADFHIHSPFSRATSKALTPENLDYWARIKGLKVIGIGDFTHVRWLIELQNKLEPAEQGLFKLKKEFQKPHFLSNSEDPRFMLTTEISSIYKKDGKVRKVHNIIFAPDFKTVEKIRQSLLRLNCNIDSDGRPIIGLDSRDLLEICLEASKDIFFVPAHIWTPWFSVLGSKSGFNSIEECFGDLSGHIYALETGLSSDPAMNWMCDFLDRFLLISNSDAHSPSKLAREANIFDCDVSYNEIINVMKNPNSKKFLGTIEFFPQEGKYHYDGHRKCDICWDPVSTLKNKGICPKCKRKVTVGVMNRVAELSDRQDLSKRKNRFPFYSAIPLREILSEIYGVGVQSKKIEQEYFNCLRKIGPELDILLWTPLDQIKEAGMTTLVEAIRRMRAREVIVEEGFDGEFGRIKLFKPSENVTAVDDESLFADTVLSGGKQLSRRDILDFDLLEYRKLKDK
ncbi:MAG: endonuclease Q family protein [Patescibacteria group bacterium]|nr:endonuclease Q family protein [Patescibacteria group bacterium]